MAELQNQVTLASGETSQLSDKNMALREKNLAQQASFGQGQPVQTPQPIQPTPTAQGQTTPSQPTPEPVLFQEPTPVNVPKEKPLPTAEVKVELPKVDKAPIETPQDELNRIQQEVVVKGQIDSVKAKEKTGKITEFTGLVQSGADTKTLADYARKNPALAQDFNAVLRNQFKNKGNLDFYSKYNGASNDKLYASVKTGDVVVGDARYNLLPETQRQSFEAFQRAKDAGNVPQTKEELINFNSPQYKVDFTEIETLTNKMFNSDLKTKLEQARNDPRVVQLETQLNAKAVEIEKFDLATMKASRTLKDELGNAGYTPAYISAMVRDDEEARRLERMEMLLEYNGLQANLSTIKADIQTDIELYKYEDEIAREQYKTMLELYETRRSEQVQAKSIEDQRAYEVEQQAFLEENKKLAEERQNTFQKELIKIQQDFELKNQKPTYQLGRDGKMYAIVNGTATVVKSDIGEVMFGEEEEKYQKQIYKNDDGTFTEVTTYKDGRATSVSTYDIEGNKVTGVPDSIQDIIAQCRVTGQCGAGANDYAEKLGLGRIFGDTYESKAQYIQEGAFPSVGGFAIWNPQQGQGKYKENGHVGIVTGYNEKTGKVTITDWNWNGEEKQDTREVNVSEITFNGGFYNPDTLTQEAQYTDDDIALLSSVTKLDKQGKDTLKSAGLSEQDWANFNAGMLPPTPSQKQQAQEILNTINSLETSPGFGIAVGKSSLVNKVPGTAGADFLRNFESFRDNLVLPNLGQLKGPMSDKDIQFLRNSATALDVTMSEQGFKNELNKIKQQYVKIAGVETQDAVEVQVENVSIGGTGLKDRFKKSISTQEMGSIINR